MKPLRRIIILLLLILTCLSAATAEAGSVFSEYEDSLGGYYSSLSGYGLSYQKWSGKLGIQAAAGLMYFPDDYYYQESSYSSSPVENDIFVYDAGIGLQYMLFQDSYDDWFSGCLYLVTGITHFGSITETYYYSGTADADRLYPYESKSAPRFIPGFSTGVGIGTELVFFDHFSIPVEIALNGSWDIDSRLPFEAGIKVLGGFRYRF